MTLLGQPAHAEWNAKLGHPYHPVAASWEARCMLGSPVHPEKPSASWEAWGTGLRTSSVLYEWKQHHPPNTYKEPLPAFPHIGTSFPGEEFTSFTVLE